MPEDILLCPKCGSRIQISAALTNQIRADLTTEIAKRHDAEMEQLRNEAATQEAATQKLSAQLESQRRSMEAELTKRLEASSDKLRAEAAAKAQEEVSRAREEAAAQKRSMEKELNSRIEAAREEAAAESAEKARSEVQRANREAFAQKAAAEKLQTEMESQKRSMEAELSKRLQTARQQAQTEAAAKNRAEIDQARRAAAEQADAVQKLSAQLESQRRNQEADLKRQLQAQRKMIEADVEEKLSETHRARELVTRRQLSDARTQIEDLQRKLETSSRQLEGDVVEADLHSLLSRAYPSDEIRALSKRGGGADVHQRIYSDQGREVGSIVWESKSTALWNNAWLEKLRLDQRRVKADVAVLVTTARPKNCGRLELRDGVWITEHPLAIGVAAVFRSSLLQLSQYKDLPPETAEKFAVIQRYLSSTEFRHRFEAIIEAFQTMSSDLATEKRAAERHWAQREKQLQLVIENVSGMYGELRAVTGPTLARVRRLELPSAD
jgi:hypothetical protein